MVWKAPPYRQWQVCSLPRALMCRVKCTMDHVLNGHCHHKGPSVLLLHDLPLRHRFIGFICHGFHWGNQNSNDWKRSVLVPVYIRKKVIHWNVDHTERSNSWNRQWKGLSEFWQTGSDQAQLGGGGWNAVWILSCKMQFVNFRHFLTEAITEKCKVEFLFCGTIYCPFLYIVFGTIKKTHLVYAPKWRAHHELAKHILSSNTQKRIDDLNIFTVVSLVHHMFRNFYQTE